MRSSLAEDDQTNSSQVFSAAISGKGIGLLHSLNEGMLELWLPFCVHVLLRVALLNCRHQPVYANNFREEKAAGSDL